jgi:divalent metal cation (Fe/Co/Zn/Cd) transporter
MDRAPEPAILERVRTAACAVDGVLGVEKIQARRAGMGYLIAIHVQADPDMPLRDSHILGGRVRSAIRNDPMFLDALIHMEPWEPD